MANLLVNKLNADRIRGDSPPAPRLDPQKFQEKELIILALYINIAHQSEARARANLCEWYSTMKNFVNEIEKTTKYEIGYLILPQKEAETRLECVFPKNPEEIDMSIFSKITEETLLP